MDLLLGSEDVSSDRRHFFKTQLIFWLLAAPDGHAKNYSLAILAGGRYRATPIYDVLSAHPVIGHGANQLSPQKAKMAMAVRGRSNHYRFAEIRRRHWIEQAKQIGFGQTEAEQLIEEVLALTNEVIRKVEPLIPNGFPMDVAEAIFSGMRDQCSKLEVDR
jgi:serine/threonine-protein kinase HipA